MKKIQHLKKSETNEIRSENQPERSEAKINPEMTGSLITGRDDAAPFRSIIHLKQGQQKYCTQRQNARVTNMKYNEMMQFQRNKQKKSKQMKEEIIKNPRVIGL